MIDLCTEEKTSNSPSMQVQAKLYESIASLAHRVGYTGGAGVIMDIHTGEVLALESYPEYNNNIMTNASSSEEKRESRLTFQSSSKVSQSCSIRCLLQGQQLSHSLQ